MTQVTRVKEGAEKWAAKEGIIVTESQMIRELQAENQELKRLLNKRIKAEGHWLDVSKLQAKNNRLKEKIKQIHDIVSGSFSDSKTVSMIYDITKA